MLIYRGYNNNQSALSYPFKKGDRSIRAILISPAGSFRVAGATTYDYCDRTAVLAKRDRTNWKAVVY